MASALKESLKKSIHRSHHVPIQNIHAQRISRQYREKAAKWLGKKVVWHVKHNHELKAPQLVTVTEIYPNHVVLEKLSYSIDGQEYRIRYSVSYCSMYCGFDTFSEVAGFDV